MDVAYDHIQEEVLLPEDAENENKQSHTGGLNTEFQEAFKAVSSSPWGARLGGFLGQVKKQGESLYLDAQKEYSNASAQATRGLTDLKSSIVEQTRGISISQTDDVFVTDPTLSLPADEKADSFVAQKDDASSRDPGLALLPKPESLPADILKEASSIASRFRPDAAKWLKEAQRAEDAADEALLKFGTNVRNFLRDTITVTAPDAAAAAGLPIRGWRGHVGSQGDAPPEVLFETNDDQGRRVFHSNRFDAQLHVIHRTPDRFLHDPEGEEWDAWTQDFEIEKQTDRIAADLDKHADLRRIMERLVPEKVDYPNFWKRYYFLRKAVEEEEKRRREVLKGAAQESQEDIDWGDDDDDVQDDCSITPVGGRSAVVSTTPQDDASKSSITLKAPLTKDPSKDHLSPRRSQEGSDASYDIVSGATTQTVGSPENERKEEVPDAKKDDSDEEQDWE